jgi:hypothetical protein
MAAMGDLVAGIKLQSAPFLAGMKQVQSQTSSFVSNILKIAAPIGLAFGFEHVLSAAGEQIRAEKKLDSVLRSTGNAAGLSSKEIKDYAAELQKATNFSDEQTIAGASVLATFTQIKGVNFKEAIASAQDLSTIMGQDLQSSVVQIGKALNDPIKGVTALRRVGVSFTQQQLAQIKAMTQAGNVAGAQKLILKELQTEFGGAAKALASPITQAKNMANDLAENLGMVLGPALKEIAGGFSDLIGPTAEGRESFKVFGSMLAELAKFLRPFPGAVLGPLGTGFLETAQLVEGVFRGASVSVQDFCNIAVKGLYDIHLSLTNLVPQIQGPVEQMGKNIASMWAGISTIFNKTPLLDKLDEFETRFGRRADLGNKKDLAAAGFSDKETSTMLASAKKGGNWTTILSRATDQLSGGVGDEFSKAFTDMDKNIEDGLKDSGGMRNLIQQQRKRIGDNVAAALAKLPTSVFAPKSGKEIPGMKNPSLNPPMTDTKKKQEHQEKLTAELRGSKEDLSSIVERLTGHGKGQQQQQIAKATQQTAQQSVQQTKILTKIQEELEEDEVFDLLAGV